MSSIETIAIVANATRVRGRELDQLLEQETFPPPERFRERAVVSDPSIYDEAEADDVGFWAQRAEALHWDRKWDLVLD